MKKYVIAAVLLVLLIIWILSNGMYSVSTDKTVYASGETVKIRWSEIKLLSCSNDLSTEIYRQVGNEWKRVEDNLIGFRAVCVNGEVIGTGMPSDMIICESPSAKQGEYTWNGEFYDYKGAVNTCKSKSGQVNGTFGSYEYITAPAGKYKVKFGSAESFFEIRAE